MGCLGVGVGGSSSLLFSSTERGVVPFVFMDDDPERYVGPPHGGLRNTTSILRVFWE